MSTDVEPPPPPLPPAFAALADTLPAPVRALIVDGVPPESVKLEDLLDSLGLQSHYAEHSYSSLRSLRLLRLARGLPAEPPLTSAGEADVATITAALSPSACAQLRALVDDDARRSTAADSVDGAPDHQVDLSVDSLAVAIGGDEADRLQQLGAEFLARLRNGGSVEAPAESEGGAPQAAAAPSEIFVRRYSPDTRVWIPFHCDRSRCTVNVALSDDEAHAGGRLIAIFGGVARTILRSEGDATIHSSKLCHAVTRMTRGTRYSLILFYDG